MTIRTIKPSGGDYATLTGWVSSLSPTLSAPQQADIYNFGPGGLVEGAGVAFRGFTTTATNKLILNVPPGERHTGIAHSGAYVTNFAGSNAITTIRIASFLNHFEVHGLEVESRDTASAWHWNLECDANNSFVMDHCIIHAVGGPIWAFAPKGNYIYRNTVFYCTSAYILLDKRNTASAEVSNCTAYAQSCDCIYAGGPETTITNCYGGGSSKGDFVGNPAGSHNASSDGSATILFPIGSLNDVSGASVFTSVMTGSEDFHLKAGANALVDAGTTLINITDDIVGTLRPQESACDISAFERISVGGRANVLPQLTNLEVGLGAAIMLPRLLATNVNRRSLMKGLWLP